MLNPANLRIYDLPKILFWDVECSTVELRVQTYDLKNYNRYYDHRDITRDWHLLGAAWKFIQDESPQAISVRPDDPLNDYGVVTTLHKVLSEADILCGHNSDAFDLKKFNTRALFHGLPPIPPKQTIDTLKAARKHFKITSNSLAYLARFLGLEAKDESPDWDLCLAGDAEALRYMRAYNKQDVVVTEQVYMKLRPFMTTHPNAALYTHGTHHDTCPKCGSDDLMKQGHKFTAAGKYQQYQCRNCGTWSRGKKNVKTTVEVRV